MENFLNRDAYICLYVNIFFCKPELCNAKQNCVPVHFEPCVTLFFNVLIYILVFLEPNDESGANVDAAKMWRENRDEFNKIAEKLVRKTLGIPTNP